MGFPIYLIHTVIKDVFLVALPDGFAYRGVLVAALSLAVLMPAARAVDALLRRLYARPRPPLPAQGVSSGTHA